MTGSSGAKDKYLAAYLIRRVEQRLLELFSQKKLFGTIHTCIGQEFAALAMARALREGDVVFSNHRCHGHFIARTDQVEGLIAEIMGKKTGVCGGFGGSQHLCYEDFFSNGIQGGIVPVSAGIALAQKREGRSNVTVVCLGDGTLGEGVVYETLNIAAKWELPLVFWLEDNLYSQSTSSQETLAGSIIKRAGAFGIKTFHGNTWQHEELDQLVQRAVKDMRADGRPLFFQVDTYRLRAHSKGDDDRDPEEIQRYECRDPLNVFLHEHENDAEVQKTLRTIDARVDAAIASAEDEDFAEIRPAEDNFKSLPLRAVLPESAIQARAINEALAEKLDQHSGMILIGEDIRSPYGGAFKVTKGLSDRFPDRVINTPLSEASIVGIGNGLALRGMRPVVELMFGDFVTLAFDQIVNHASKFAATYNRQVRVPVVIRTPMGGGRGYGATHSQNLEKHLAGLPDVDIFSLHGRSRVGAFYRDLVENVMRPAIVIENKLLYAVAGDEPVSEMYRLYETDERYPTTVLRPSSAADITVVAFGRMSRLAEQVAATLYEEEEILCELVFPLRISPLNIGPVLESVLSTQKLLCLEEGCADFDLSSSVIAELAVRWRQPSAFVARKIAAAPMPIPSAGPLEQSVLPSFTEVYETALDLYDA